MRFFLQTLGNDFAAFVSGCGDQGVCGIRFGYSRRTINNQHRCNASFVQQHFGFQQFQLEPHRAQLLAQEEFIILKRQLIRLALGLGGYGSQVFGKTGFLLGFVKVPVFQIFFCHWLCIARPPTIVTLSAIGRAIFHRFTHIEMEMIGMRRIVIGAEHRAKTLTCRFVEAAQECPFIGFAAPAV